MMRKLTRTIHILAVCIFVGSIPAHIVLGQLANSHLIGGGTMETFAAYQQAKYGLTIGLTTAGIILTLLSGVALVIRRKPLLRQNWLRAKLCVVAAIAINGAAVLTPLAEQMRDLAVAAVETGALDAAFHAAENTEAIAGAINLALIVVAIALAVFKPQLRIRAEAA
ncbi:MAG: DUF2269 family protein [Rhodospirillaceae bacterium]|jgi:hypothetical protein|nr:DUF2269 family protein [Rhodospirillaceae bacterium]